MEHHQPSQADPICFQTLASSSIVGFLLQTSLHTTQLEYGHSTNFLATNDPNINISGVTPTWLTRLHKNCMEVGIHLEGGWSAPRQRVGDFHIAELPARGNVMLTNYQWKLYRETYIFLQVTTIANITTACGSYFNREARAVTQSYPSVFKWPRQQHNITYKHKLIFCQILTANTNRHYKIQQPLGPWNTKPTTSRLYHQTGEVVYSGNALGQWTSHSRMPRRHQLRSNKVEYSLNGEVNARLPLRHQIADGVVGRENLVVVEHQLSEMEYNSN